MPFSYPFQKISWQSSSFIQFISHLFIGMTRCLKWAIFFHAPNDKKIHSYKRPKCFFITEYIEKYFIFILAKRKKLYFEINVQIEFNIISGFFYFKSFSILIIDFVLLWGTISAFLPFVKWFLTFQQKKPRIIEPHWFIICFERFKAFFTESRKVDSFHGLKNIWF